MTGIILFFMFLLGSWMNVCSSESNLDCSTYKSDKEIIQSLPFRVSINPYITDPRVNPFYAIVNSNGDVSELSLSSLNSIPLSIFCLSSLRSLSIKYSTNLSIPPEIGQVAFTLLSLEFISISNALILPPDLFNLTKLSILTIVSCGLETLPEAIERLSLLSNLTLADNRLVSLPAGLSKMTSLRYLTVNRNNLLSSLDSLSGSQSLMQLNASYCAIDHLPTDITNLMIIEMNNNSLTSLASLGTIVSLDSISFSFRNNKITSIPAAIGPLRTLHYLDLSNNLLTELPKTLYNIVQLWTVDLRKNNFDDKEIEWIQGRFRSTVTTVYI